MAADQLWAPWRLPYVRRQQPQPDRCVFCAAREEADNPLVVWRGRRASVILNAYPYAPGHMLIFPHRHVAEPEHLDRDEQLEVWELLVRSIAAARSALNADGFNAGLNLGKVAGAGIPGHIHLHVVPRWEGDKNFIAVLADTHVISQALEETAETLRAAFTGGS